MANNPQSSAAQYRPMVPGQQGHHFIPGSQQFHPAGQGQPLQYSQQMQPYPLAPNQPGHAQPSSQALPMQYYQPRPTGPPHTQHPAPPFNNQMPGMHYPSFTYAQPSFVQPQNNPNSVLQFQPMSQEQPHVVPPAGQPWMSLYNHQGAAVVTPQQQPSQQPISTPLPDPAVNVPNQTQPSPSDWQEHVASDGRRYYFNKSTRQSSWEKPLELMTPLERADASTVWKEYTSADGKKYYYNKVTRESKWTIPEELKLAREQAQKEVAQGTQSERTLTPPATASAELHVGASSVGPNTSTQPGTVSSPIAVSPMSAFSNASPVIPSKSLVETAAKSSMATGSVGVQLVAANVSPLTASNVGSTGLHSTLVDTNTKSVGNENQARQDIATSIDGVLGEDIEEAKKGMAVAGKVNVTASEERAMDDEPLVYASKQEAKNAFKSLLESANVHSDWTWEQAMREIINDKRYGTLRTLGERKQAFNEYLGQRKKLENEERRIRQKRAREEFTKMLEESKTLTSAVRWSKAVTMFENDERFKAVERARDREDLYESYIVELERKEKEIAAEEHKRNISKYKEFLESCDFIKVNSQWRKVQDRLEDDERCSCLDKFDRLLIFQDYIRDLEKEEAEQKKIQKEKLRRIERKNRDEFRKLLEEHAADGTITAKTQWRDYCMKVKDLPQCEAVLSNTFGSSTPKDLFEDVAEELGKQFAEDKGRVKDAMKQGQITMVTSWTFEEFKAAVLNDLGSPPISELNLKLAYEDLLERAREKEEKEAKKRQRIADDFYSLLYTFKEITVSSSWEDCKGLFEEGEEYRLVGDEDTGRQVFEEYITSLQEKAKEKDRRREEEKSKKEKEREEKEKRKDKERKEKDKEREKEKGRERSQKDETDSETVEMTDSHDHKEDKKREKDGDRKHRRRHQSSIDDGSDKDKKDDSKKHKHSGDRRKSRKRAYTPESDGENRHRRHRKDRDGSRKNRGHEELEDGEVGEDGEIH